MVIFILWIILSFVIASAGSSRKIGFGWALFCCLLFSPLIGAIIIILSDKKSDSPITTNSHSTKFAEAIEQAKMMEFKGQKEQALDKYLDGYYLFQSGLSKKEMFVTERTLSIDKDFRDKIIELGGMIPEKAIDVSELHKQTVKESEERKEKQGNKSFMIVMIVLVLLVVVLALMDKFK